MAKRERVVFQNNNNNTTKEIMFRAILKRDIKKMKTIYDKNAINNAEFLVSKTKTFLSPLAFAVIYDHRKVKFLVEECGVNVENGQLRDDKYASPLWIATLYNNYDAVTYLVKKGANVNERGGDDNLTPVGLACASGNLDMVEFLIEQHNADAEITADGGRTCLMVACENRYLDIAQYLLEKVGTNVNRKDDKGQTVLHKCIRNKSNIFEFLIQYGADIEVKDEFGNTPLFLSILLDHNSYASSYFYCKGGKRDEIDALELRGAMAVKKDNNWRKAINNWKLSLIARYDYDTKPIHSSPLITALNEKEFTTMKELEEMSGCQIYTQVLLIFDRLLGPKSPQPLNFITDIVRNNPNKCNLKLLMRTFESVQPLNSAILDTIKFLDSVNSEEFIKPYRKLIIDRVEKEINAYEKNIINIDKDQTYYNLLVKLKDGFI